MTAEAQPVLQVERVGAEGPSAQSDPGVLETFWASFLAVVKKESRWRMRGRRAFVIVTVYLALLALLVLFVYQTLYDRAVFESTFRFDDFGNPLPTTTNDLGFVPGSVSAGIGQAIFGVVLIVQTLLIVILAPALTSGAISMEREKQTLELLITTPVSTLGMVTGKLISSLGFVLLLILASIPLMSAVVAFGGVAPEDVIKAYIVLFATAFAFGTIGLFMSALVKRTQMATAISYILVFLLSVGTVVLHVWWYGNSGELDEDRFFRTNQSAPDALVWLNPFVADADLMCTAIPDPFGASCSYTGVLIGQEVDPSNPPRDAFWPRAVVAMLVFGGAALVATTQLIAPSRRWRQRRRPQQGRLGPQQAEPSSPS